MSYNDDGMKDITVGALTLVLAGLSSNYRLCPNAVGNIMIFNPDGYYVGFIDIAREYADLFPDQPEDAELRTKLEVQGS